MGSQLTDSRVSRCGRALCATVLAACALVAPALSAGVAEAAGPPLIEGTSVSEVTANSAKLHAEINPDGLSTTYRFEYLTEAAYQANLEATPPRQGFLGATMEPPAGVLVGSGTGVVPAVRSVSELSPETGYRFRVVAINADGTAVGPEHPFGTAAPTNVFELLDHRGWEMVSPIDKDGGAIQSPGTIWGGGVFQAARAGGVITYSSASSFGSGAQGAPAGSQYLSEREGEGWETANITTPLLSGSYGSEPDGTPYQLFAGDLGFGILSNGERCRGQAEAECPVANSSLPGSDAPAGYRNYYRRTPSGSFESLLTAADLAHTTLGPGQFELRLVAATSDLAHIVLSSCAALTTDATEVAAPAGCDATDQNLYEWSAGRLALINRLPGDPSGSPGAVIAAPSGAISEGGGHVYWTEGGELYMTEAGETKPVDESIGGGGEFQIASSDGSVAYLTKAGQLYRYSADAGATTPLAVSGEVEGVLGASADGATVYYATSEGLFVRSGSTVTKIATAADPGDHPPATGTSRVSADGRHLLFLSTAELTGYPNEGRTEVFLYGPPPDGAAPLLTCVSCNPTGERPQGPATIPGARRNGSGPEAIDAYEPRDLSSSGNRVFFESADSLVSQDSNGRQDVYEWEAAGEGTCSRAGGCVQLISGGRDPEPSYFLDADEAGDDAFFLTAASLYPLDPGSYDVYDARVGGGFTVPTGPIPCVGDACQVLPEPPEDPTPGTLVGNPGNPPPSVAGAGKTSRRHKRHKRHGHRRKQSKSRHHKKQRAKGGGRKR